MTLLYHLQSFDDQGRLLILEKIDSLKDEVS